MSDVCQPKSSPTPKSMHFSSVCFLLYYTQVGPISVPSSREPCCWVLITEPAKACLQSGLETLREGSMPCGLPGGGRGLKRDGKSPGQKVSTQCCLGHQPFLVIGRIPCGF